MTKFRQFALWLMAAVLALCAGFAVYFAVPTTASADHVEINGENAANYLDIDGATLKGFKKGVTIPNKVSLVIPENVTAIEANAFDGRREIISVTLNTVLTATGIGSNAFRDCSGLVEVYDRTAAHITDGLGLTTTSLGRLVYSALNVYSAEGGSQMTTDDNGFVFCRDTRSDNRITYLVGYVGNGGAITLPEGDYEIYQYAFWKETGVTSVTVPEGITTIGNYAFYECYDLERVVLPTTLVSIGNSAFRCNTGSEGSTEKITSKITIITYAGAAELTGNPVNLPKNLKTIGAYAFSGLVNITDIIIPESVTEIGAFAFEDCTSGVSAITDRATLTFEGAEKEVEYDGEGNVTGDVLPLVINRYAFYRCSWLRTIELPQRLKQMYRQVFAGCSNLAFAYMPDGVTYYAVDESEATFFEGTTNLIFDSYKSYEEALNSNYIKNHVRNMTYIVDVVFKEVTNVVGGDTTVEEVVTEQRLYGGQYRYVKSDYDGSWAFVDSVTFPLQDGYSSSVWYLEENAATVATFNNVNELLRGVKEQGADEIQLYAIKLAKPEINAVDGLVYDSEATYLSSDWKSFLNSSFGENQMSDYAVKIGGKLDGVIHDAGDYEISVGIKDEAKYGVWAEDVKTVLTVGKRPYDVGLLRWVLPDSYSAGGAVNLYIYNYDDGSGTYPSLTRLSADRANQLGVTYNTRVTVANSIVRYRNEDISISLALGDLVDEFEVTYIDNVKNAIGTHQTTATVTSKGNYVLVEGSEPSAMYGLNVALADDVCSIVKTWYMIMVENKLYTDSSKNTEFTIDGWTYTATTGIPVSPVLEFSEEGAELTFNLSVGGGVTFSFGTAEFARYINDSMPAGDYTLTVNVPQVGDGDDSRPGYSVNFPFTVAKAKLGDNVLNEIATKLTGKTFYQRYDGEVKLYDKSNELTFLNSVPNPERKGIWQSTTYNNMYATGYTLSYNLYRMLSNTYYTESTLNGAPARPVNPETYTVYYQIEALNFESLIDRSDDVGRRKFVFTTVIYEAVTVPTLNAVTYTGYTVYPTIENNRGYYLELVENGDENYYIKSGNKKVNLILEDPEHSRWIKDGKELSGAVAQVDFVIDRAVNNTTGDLNLIRWTWGSYNPVINIPILDTQFTDKDDPDFITFILTSDSTRAKYYYNPKGSQLGFEDAPAGAYHFTAIVKGYLESDESTEKYDWHYFETFEGIEVNIGKASNRWTETPNIIRWTWGEFDATQNLITAKPMFLDEKDSVKFSIVKADGSSIDPRLNNFVLTANGLVPNNVAELLKKLDAGSYALIAKVANDNPNYEGLDTSATGSTPLQFNIMTATNRWSETPNIIRWQYGQYDKTINKITAKPVHGKQVEYRIFTRDTNGNYNLVSFGENHEGVGIGTTAKDAFVVGENGIVSDEVADVLSQLSAGTYYLLATVNSSQVSENKANYTGLNNDNEHFTPLSFVVQKATNTWKTAPNIIRWTYGNYNRAENVITAMPAYGIATIKITDAYGNECDATDLGKLGVGTYCLTATVEETGDFTGLNATLTFQVFEPTDTSFFGMQVASTVISSLTIAALVAAAVVMLLPKKGGKK